MLSPYAYVWLVSAWVVTGAVLTTQSPDRAAEEDVERYFGGLHSGANVGAEADAPR